MADSVKKINRLLAENYGKLIDGRPIFRVVWSTDQTEKRKGEFNVYYGHIFVRKEVGIEEVKKYPYCLDRWVLEKLILLPNPELMQDRIGSYEPIYVCQTKDGIYLPPLWKVFNRFIYDMLYGRKLTLSEQYDIEQKKEDDEVKYFEDQLEDETGGYIPTMLRNREAVVVPKTFMATRDQARAEMTDGSFWAIKNVRSQDAAVQ